MTTSRFSLRRLLPALVCAMIVAPALSAQIVLGPGDDAWTLPSGVFRLGFAPRLLSAAERFGANGNRESIGASYSGLLGTASFPSLLPLESTINAMSGVQTFRVTLGTARTDMQQTVGVVPLELAAGITSRITLRIAAPFFTGKQEAQWSLDGSTASVGLNAELLAAGPLPLNAGLVGGLDSAAATLERLADACVANPASDARCAQLTGDITAVRALIAQTRTMTDGLSRTYGGRTTVRPSPFVPLVGGTAYAAIVAQIAALRSGFALYGTTSVAEGAAPAAPGLPLTVEDLRALLADSTYRYGTGAVSRRYRQGFGDVDVGVSFLLHNGLKSTDKWSREVPAHFAFRQSLGFTYRVGTGTPPDPDDPLALATGDGQNDLEFTSATDFVANRHAWGSFIVRYTRQQPLEGIARIPDGSGSPFIPFSRRKLARTELGDRVTIEAAPRWVLNEYLAAGVRYRWTHTQGETITEVAPAGQVALSYSAPATSMHELGIGFTWSSIAAWRKHNTRWPLELQWEHTLVVAGSGGAPRFNAERISLRAYFRLWGAGR